MRIRLGVAMAPRGGRTAIVAAEVREGRQADGRIRHEFTVGAIDRVSPFTVEAARDRVAAMMTVLEESRPCCIVDVGSPQGLALRQELRGAYSPALHRAHAYPGVGMRTQLFSAFLQAYSSGQVRFRPGIRNRADMDRALVFYLGGGVAASGLELSSEDEALVMALGLAIFWPKHGPAARGVEKAPSGEGA